MGEFSIWHWMVVLLVVLLLFGSGKVSNIMGDFAKGIKAFKKNMAEDEPKAAASSSTDSEKSAPGLNPPQNMQQASSTAPKESTTVSQH